MSLIQKCFTMTNNQLLKAQVKLQLKCFITLSSVLCFIGGTLFGGIDDGVCTKLYQYNFASKTWVYLSCSLASHASRPFVCSSSRIYLQNDYTPEYYTIATNTWTYISKPNKVTSSLVSMCEISGMLYLFGGENLGNIVIRLLCVWSMTSAM